MNNFSEQNDKGFLVNFFLKNKALLFCAILSAVYAVIDTVLSVVLISSEAVIPSAITRIIGILLFALFFIMLSVQSIKKDASSLFIALVIFSAIFLLINSVLDNIFLGVSLHSVLRILLSLFLTAFAVLLLTSLNNRSFSIALGFVVAVLTLTVAASAVISLINSIGVFNECFADTYDWDFLSESVGGEGQKNIGDYSYLFMNVNPASSFAKIIFKLRLAERISFIVFTGLSSLILFRVIATVSDEKKRQLLFNENNFNDGMDIRRQRQTSRKVQRDRFGFPIEDNDFDDDFSDDFSDSSQSFDDDFDDSFSETDAQTDYLDEKTGIFYYYDDETGKYYYIDKTTGESRYKSESKKSKSSDRNKSGETMPWEEEFDDDNIYRY